MNKMDSWQFVEPKKIDQEIIHTITNPPNVYGYGHLPFLKDVVETLNIKKKTSVDEEEASKSLKLIIAMLKSAKENREVFINEIHDLDDKYYY
jgi:hypothetical protein